MEMDEVHINEPYAVYGPGTVEYGRNVFVAEHAWLSLATEHALVTVGDNTQLGRFFTIAAVIIAPQEFEIQRQCYLCLYVNNNLLCYLANWNCQI
ncbi:hypothetical protein [Sulfoacidibacillus ferrooxidans]|uniref:Uncharacterized protein n=1 Tax=Sulfoacidibacillus ferrooxidans TaxID=2005001 RepID=A0A9X1VB19_9BACL|nr:hypothetical protein [Sulfoacidibacillus ferrooxidans]MCI0184440.1 hypothetical protein [Sulfoacidibacillus ferrooxidans]